LKIPIFLLACLLITRTAYPWGAEGHQAIADAAETMLTPQAAENVKKILGDESLADVSTWLDDVRNAKKHHSGPLKYDDEAQAFNAKFPANEVWHFVNLPVGSPLYLDPSPFASRDDIVHAIARAVDVLEGRSTEFTPLQALRILVHLVGDIHQPLHTVAGYYDVTDLQHPKLVSNPAIAKTKPQDRGGNQLFFTASLELHALWDTRIPMRIAKTPEVLAVALEQTGTVASWPTLGDYHHWQAAWAGDSATVAMKIYAGIQFGAVTMKGNGEIDRIEITLPGGTRTYDETQEPIARLQLAKAAVHLAQLLNSIRFVVR
jgi:hypothetical protein